MGTLTEKKFTFNLLTVIIIALFLICLSVAGWLIYINKIGKLEAQYTQEVKLKNALMDSVTYYRNSHDELVAQKLTLQTDIKTLTKINDKLTDNQQELIKRVREIEKENSIIIAALVETNVILDSLRNAMIVTVDTTKNIIAFSDTTKDIKYKIIVFKVRPSNINIKPELNIAELILPNKSFVEFHWGERKEGYPVSFSISNSNPYFKTVNIDSYAIPQLNKKIIDPTGWDKFKNFFKKSGNVFVTVGIGVAVGAGVTYVLMK